MGADVAASPHCPAADDTRPGRRGSPREAVFETAAKPGAPQRFPESFRDPKVPFGSPAGSPSGPKPWRFAAWRKFRTEAPPSGRVGFQSAEAPRSPSGWISGRNRVSRLAGHGPKSWALPLRSSRTRRPGPARQVEGRSLFPPGGGAQTEVPPSAGPILDRSPVSGLARFSRARRLPRSGMGASRSLPLSHPLKGKPAASAWRRLRQPPCLRAVASSPGGTMRSVSLGPWLEAFFRCRKIVSATTRSCHGIRVAPSGFSGDSAVENEDNGHK